MVGSVGFKPANNHTNMSLALLFAGQGAQKIGMGKSLYESSVAARVLYDKANNVLGWDLKKISFEGPDTELTQTKVCQPALFVHGLALLAALREKGDADMACAKYALGLSLGEITALTAAGVFDFATGLRVVAERGRLMQMACEATHGSMAAIIGESRETVAALCEKFDLEAANFNCPGQIIISGEKQKIVDAVASAKAGGAKNAIEINASGSAPNLPAAANGVKRAIELNVAGAYHSRLMAPARDAFAKFLETVTFAAPKVTVFTNTTGEAVSDPADIRAALAKQVVSSVLWEDCIVSAQAAGATAFLELGPGGVLAGHVKRINKDWPVSSKAEYADL
jgi:[acyl-carrier-protein] S-malonyltransferase